jgi:hypothetical protein
VGPLRACARRSLALLQRVLNGHHGIPATFVAFGLLVSACAMALPYLRDALFAVLVKQASPCRAP